jgi:NIMA (never in mitosis gene a)-related kinase
MSSKEIEEVENEAKIQQSFNSIYIVQCYESFKDENNLNIVMEYCDNGDLNQYLVKNQQLNKYLTEEKIWSYFIQMCLGLAQIHAKKILHRDIKSMNMFMTKDDKIKIGDLGVAKLLCQTQFAKTYVGTPYYLSPEICEEQPYNEKSDIWALGIILYEMCTFKKPFNAANQFALTLKILKGKFDPIPSSYSQDLKNLIDYLLQKNYRLRPSIFKILTDQGIILY